MSAIMLLLKKIVIVSYSQAARGTYMVSITYNEFTAVDIRIGTVLRAESFPEARKPAYKIWVDFGAEYGVRQTSAQVTVHYDSQGLVGKQVLGCLNLGTKKIAGFTSEFLLLGFPDESGAIVLATATQSVPNGAKIC